MANPSKNAERDWVAARRAKKAYQHCAVAINGPDGVTRVFDESGNILYSYPTPPGAEPPPVLGKVDAWGTLASLALILIALTTVFAALWWGLVQVLKP